MYEIEKDSYIPDNFMAGSFPIAKDFGTIKTGAKIKQYAPVVQGSSGIEEATAATLDKLIGIAAEEPNGVNIVYYMTGEFFENAIQLPNGITLDALKPACRKLGIFLR